MRAASMAVLPAPITASSRPSGPGSPRSAAALVATNAEVAVLDRAAFLRLVQAEPGFALYVLQVLAQRLRRLGDALADGDAVPGEG